MAAGEADLTGEARFLSALDTAELADVFVRTAKRVYAERPKSRRGRAGWRSWDDPAMRAILQEFSRRAHARELDRHAYLEAC